MGAALRLSEKIPECALLRDAVAFHGRLYSAATVR